METTTPWALILTVAGAGGAVGLLLWVVAHDASTCSERKRTARVIAAVAIVLVLLISIGAYLAGR